MYQFEVVKLSRKYDHNFTIDTIHRITKMYTGTRVQQLLSNTCMRYKKRSHRYSLEDAIKFEMYEFCMGSWAT